MSIERVERDVVQKETMVAMESEEHEVVAVHDDIEILYESSQELSIEVGKCDKRISPQKDKASPRKKSKKFKKNSKTKKGLSLDCYFKKVLMFYGLNYISER